MMVFFRFTVIFLAGFFLTFANPTQEDQFDSFSKINTRFNEFSPTVDHSGNFMLFNSKRSPDKFMDIYISYYKNREWNSPEKFNVLNSPFNDETPYISRDGKTIVFASDRDGSHELKLDRKNVLISYDIYWSRKVNGQWSVPERITGQVNTRDHERAPSLSADNSRLYFTRWASGKMENAVIMVSKLENGVFGKPQPMPKQINSGNLELALIPDPDDTGFYFSSTRSGGYGGWDIYYISAHNAVPGLPVNLGDKINTTNNETYFSVLNGRIFFCSDRKNPANDFDIVQTYLPGEKKLFFRVSDNTNQPLITDVELQNIFLNKIPEIRKTKSDPNGYFFETISSALDSIDLFIEKKGYLPYYRKITKSDMMAPQIDAVLTPVRNNNSFIIEAIYFDYNKSIIQEKSHTYLNRLANYLKKNGEIKLQIIGHTDLHGDDESNLELSKARALSVKKFLVNAGVALNRFEISGLGKTNPIINEISDHADSLNRRTEFKIIRDDGK